MPDKHAHNKPAVSAELIRQYLAGELDDKAMHALERQALDDPFLADALEGYALHAPDQQVHQEDLMARLTERVAPRKAVVRPLYPRIAAAAAILLLLFTGGWFLFRERERTPAPIAQADIAPQPAILDTPASVPAPAAAPEMAIEKAADAKSSGRQSAPVQHRSAPALAKAMEPAADVSTADDRLAEKPLERRVLKQVPPTATFSAPVSAPPSVAQAAPALAPPPTADKQLSEVTIMHPDSAAMARGNIKHADLEDVTVMGYGTARKRKGEGPKRMDSLTVRPPLNNGYVGNALEGKVAGVAVVTAEKSAKRVASVRNETQPTPVDGKEAFQQYLLEHTANPGGFNGVVRIGFTVMPDSTLKDIKVIRSVNVNAACEAEAIRVVKEGPVWKPAADGKPANVTLDVIFKEKTAQ
ncbi:energy transducer TonB [Chitinophaga varians]|uniref:energy transducer TonB n=1 Tax=Chitinophaga varians TaxID=2202339 RepID=UPI00165FA85C|nr:energy transducer TonB [Chitinophaga varians]MBC9910737.1 energy transducer TonB [Chitinophaga varians]